MKNARRAAAAGGHKTTQRRRRPPVRRRTALAYLGFFWVFSLPSSANSQTGDGSLIFFRLSPDEIRL